MAFTLLFVSMVPLVPAETCHMSGMDQAMQAEVVAPMIDWQECYIQCACRFDNHMDGMPHQLAPHLIRDVISLYHGSAALVSIVYLLILPGFIPQHSPPPPREV